MLAPFLHQLFDEGIIEISATPPDASAFDSDKADTRELLESRARSIALTLSDTAPAPNFHTAQLAAQALYHATYIYVHRESELDPLLALLPRLTPENPGPESDFGADLVLSFAPQLLKLARATASADPLVAAITDLLRPWPLSSVGVPETTPTADMPLSFWKNAALRALYIDRVIAEKDTARLIHPDVRESVTAAVGAHPELAPMLGL